MSHAPVISVRGEAVLEAPPEIARLSVNVQVQEPDRRTALDRLTAANRRCLDLLASYGTAVERAETGDLYITPLVKYRRREGDIRAYQGTVRTKVTVADFTVLGELITRLADLERTTVDGPNWALRHDSPVHARAAEQAAHAAVERARRYATALGASLTDLIELSDEGLNGRDDHAWMLAEGPRGLAAAASDSAAEPEALDLSPQIQRVTASVLARFHSTAPDLA
ncbi:SIMPL domain-containing protein [Actinomadura oligospora]|uniref:SIMPL domain-containing protein n=1 Tax=Actinomadura oligospora TaxID=111804 RepID=UPI000686506D|nr:SIMPL domain-containing protein [Actinomadura oligospora]